MGRVCYICKRKGKWKFKIKTQRGYRGWLNRNNYLFKNSYSFSICIKQNLWVCVFY